MKTHELLQESSSPFASIKELNVKFKELAADYGITLVAGMGWPQVVKDGGWYGGGIGSKGGKSKKEDTLSLPIEHRRKGFLKHLAQMLEAFMAEGRVVKVAAGAARGTHQETVIAGHAYDQLFKHMIPAKPPGNVDREVMPCVAWFVSLPKDMEGQTTLRITANFYGPPPAGEKWGGEHMYVDMGGMVDADRAKKMHAAYNKFHKGNARRTEWGKDNKSIEHHATPAWSTFMKELAPFAAKVSGQKLPAKFTGEDNGYLGFDRKILPQSALKLTPEQMDQLFDIFMKHFK